MNSLPGLARACLDVNNDFRLDGAVEKRFFISRTLKGDYEEQTEIAFSTSPNKIFINITICAMACRVQDL